MADASFQAPYVLFPNALTQLRRVMLAAAWTAHAARLVPKLSAQACRSDQPEGEGCAQRAFAWRAPVILAPALEPVVLDWLIGDARQGAGLLGAAPGVLRLSDVSTWSTAYASGGVNPKQAVAVLSAHSAPAHVAHQVDPGGAIAVSHVVRVAGGLVPPLVYAEARLWVVALSRAAVISTALPQSRDKAARLIHSAQWSGGALIRVAGPVSRTYDLMRNWLHRVFAPFLAKACAV